MLAHPTVRTLTSPPFVRLLVAARIVHPFPTALNVVATLVLAAIAHGGLPSASVLARLGAAMLCAQAAIGAANDYYDRDLDARTKTFKPIVRGVVDPKVALALAGAFAIAAGAIALTFSARSLGVGAIGLAAGLAYDARLKRSLLSPLPFMVALPALPIWVWVSLDTFTGALWWLVPFAPLAGLAVHLSNTLPDLEDDRRAGLRGLPHAIGRRASLAIAWGSFAAAIAFAFALGAHLDYDWPRFLAGALPATALLVMAIGAYVVRPGWLALQVGFGLIGMATAALAAGWLAAAA